MTQVYRYSLLADGSSDRALLPILSWLLRELAPSATWAEPDFAIRNAREPVVAEVARTTSLYRPDILFVHRDAEAVAPDKRRTEIPKAAEVVPVVPVRMTEAWLLFDEEAIRRAVGRPNRRHDLGLPAISRVEHVADPKLRLREALLTASEARGRQRSRLQTNLSACTHRVADLITDFSPLRRLSAFQRVESDCREALEQLLDSPRPDP